MTPRRALGALYLVGMALCVIGLFPPWLRLVSYIYDADMCRLPTDPGCALDRDESFSLWQMLIGYVQQQDFRYLMQVTLILLVPAALVLLFPSMAARAAFRHRAIRIWAGVGLALSGVVLAGFLIITEIEYCWGTTACGATAGSSDFWEISPGYSVLEPGFWLISSGLALFIICDLIFLIIGTGPARPTVSPEQATGLAR